MKKRIIGLLLIVGALGFAGCNTNLESKTGSNTVAMSEVDVNLKVNNVTATGHDGNVPENVLDGNLGTRWSSPGTSWLMLELESEALVSEIKTAFSKGNEREATFKYEISEDGKTWVTVFDGISSGTTDQLESYKFQPQMAKFVKFTGEGNSYNEWNSITEIEVIGKGIPKGMGSVKK